MLSVRFRSLCPVMPRMRMVSVRHMSVVGSRFMLLSAVMFRRTAMVSGPFRDARQLRRDVRPFYLSYVSCLVL
jgi:hypothetical protein